MGDIGDLGSLGIDIFGSSQDVDVAQDQSIKRVGSGETTVSGTEQLVLEPAAIEKIIRDVMGADEGLASILSGEQDAGVFNSSVAQKQVNELVANLVGELAKITGKTVQEQKQVSKQEETTDSKVSSEQETKDGGLLDTIFGFF